ncbi:hypothetical protein [Helicobacter heilmannii]|uniref:hypothetical protein n=1 Tax=Helicobacter heilmannii TaxID=35817 RepID=UPI0012E1DC1C|nr:hypothetical protein [Helicobacter heilmannii]
MAIMWDGKPDCRTLEDFKDLGKPSVGSLVGATIAAVATAYGAYKACENADRDKKENK